MTEQQSSQSSLRWVIDDLAYHQVRVLLLVDAVAAEPGHERKLDGLTKLAKLDFLVRYPALASAVLAELDDGDHRLHLTEEERSAPTVVDDPMIRYKYGPWDDRYYPVIGALVARGLLRYAAARRGSVALAPTARGQRFAAAVQAEANWGDIADRCHAIAEATAGMTGTALKDLIYNQIPGLMDRPQREVIA